MLTEKETKIRKNWLMAFFAQALFSFVIGLVTFQNIPVPDPSMVRYFWIGIAIGEFFGLGFCYLAYHFVYKKFGVKFLTAILILSMVCVPYTVWTLIFPQASMQLYTGLGTLFFAAFYIYYGFYLRKINQYVQAKRKFPEQMAAISLQFQNVSTREELETSLQEQLSLFPRMKVGIRREYELKKEQLV